jgi:regulator of sigma E protease
VSYLLAFAGFAALIILHEFGHFAAAKAVGMRVERFSLFFPPLLLKYKRGETEYAIGAVPLGGYVKITGMNPNERIPPEIAHRAYFAQPVWKRVVVIAAGPFMNFLIAFAIIWVLLLSLGQVRNALEVNFVDAGSPAAGQLQAGDRILSIDGRPGDAPGLTAAQIRDRQTRLRAVVAQHRCAGRPTDGCARTSTSPPPTLRASRSRTCGRSPRRPSAGS